MKADSVPLPLGPLVICVMGGALVLSGFIVPSIVPNRTAGPIQRPATPAINEIEAIAPLTYHDRNESIAAFQSLISRSPLSKDRSSYSRMLVQAAAPPTPIYNPEFVGLLGREHNRRALIIWNQGEAPLETAIGDDTPWGVLNAISAAELVFEGEDGEKTLRLF